jgi:hypothetical protein
MVSERFPAATASHSASNADPAADEQLNGIGPRRNNLEVRAQSYSLANAARFATALIHPSDINAHKGLGGQGQGARDRSRARRCFQASLGNEALDRARSVQGRLSGGIAERALRRRGGEDEERDEQGRVNHRLGEPNRRIG